MNGLGRGESVVFADAVHNRHCGAFRKFAEAIFGFFDRTLPD